MSTYSRQHLEVDSYEFLGGGWRGGCSGNRPPLRESSLETGGISTLACCTVNSYHRRGSDQTLSSCLSGGRPNVLGFCIIESHAR